MRSVVTTPQYPRQSEIDALALADDVRVRLARWFELCGIPTTSGLGVSGYVNDRNRPSIVIRVEGRAARALLLALTEMIKPSGRPVAEQHERPANARTPSTGDKASRPWG